MIRREGQGRYESARGNVARQNSEKKILRVKKKDPGKNVQDGPPRKKTKKARSFQRRKKIK